MLVVAVAGAAGGLVVVCWVWVGDALGCVVVLAPPSARCVVVG